jgi:hypothetical protein
MSKPKVKSQGFGDRPQYLLRIQTVAGVFKIPYALDRQSSQFKTDTCACAISRLIFVVLQHPNNPENLRLLLEAIDEFSVAKIRAIGLELEGQNFKARTFDPGGKMIQLLATELVDGWKLEERDVALDVAIVNA